MTCPAIRVTNLGKEYLLGLREKTNRDLREFLMDLAAAPLRRFRHLSGTSTEAERIWAIRDVSFDVHPGEIVGVIGRNGAGKSTLLKILTRITEPTTGRAEVRGHVGSLLEVGTGFHQELTGRENVFLNGAILGMPRAKIKQKFDEIVAFSGVEKFLDTPVKRYSSGMRVRLAFAVAAHLDPEILLIDEVLAVGDAEFQKRCLGKMGAVAKAGRTVLFVSHNMPSVRALCHRGILLADGGIEADGPVEAVVDQYLMASLDAGPERPLADREDRTGGDRFRFTDIQFLDPEKLDPLAVMIAGRPVLVRIRYRQDSGTLMRSVHFNVRFADMMDNIIFACNSRFLNESFDVPPGDGQIDCLIPRWPLDGRRYTYSVAAKQKGVVLDRVRPAGTLDCEPGDFYDRSVISRGLYRGVYVDFDWEAPH